ncbi:MAG: T9SS type A sorting domain-containing protein [Ignavibacteria bacterium]|nr:T9SS type A sorting domain-containing protein [Ignavibacteria bacterium]
MKKLFTILIVIFFVPLLLYGQEEEILNDEYSLIDRTGKMGTNYPIRSFSSQPPVMNPNATTIIDPSGDGGFENGTSFLNNGWTVTQGSYNKWYVSTLNPPGPTQGSRLIITGTSETNWSGQSSNNVNHIYRNFTVPSGETKIKLSFKYRIQNPHVNYDYLSVHVVTTSTNPSAGTLLSSGEVITLTDEQSEYVTVTITLDPSYAGTTRRLVFSWRTSTTLPNSNASIAIDEISLTSSEMTTITSTATGGNWSNPSTWIDGVVPEGEDVIINGPVFVDNSYYCNNLTVNSGSILETADITNLQLTVIGVFNVNSGAVINIGGYYGGRLVISGTGKSHSISGTINILWALRFDYPSGTSNSTVTVNNGAVIINDASADGQLCLQHSTEMTFLEGSELYNYNNISSQGLCGLNILNNGRLIINGILINGENGSFFTSHSDALTINGTLFFNSGIWTVSASGQRCNPIVYGSASTLAYTGGTLTTSNYEWQNTYRPYNVIINSTGNITLNANRTISGTLYLMGGELRNGTTNGSRLYLENNATINRSNGSIYRAPYNSTNYNVVYSNTINITTGYELPSATTTYLNNLTFQGSAVVTFNKNATVKGTATLTMTSGIVNVDTYTLMLGTSPTARGTLVPGNARVITTSTSTTSGLKLWFANSTVNDVYFPVGSASSLNTITLSFTSAPSAGSITAKFIAADPGTYSMTFLNDVGISPEPNPYLIDCYSQRGYWQLDAGDNLTGGTYDISLRGEGFNPTGSEIMNFSELRVLKRANVSPNPWTVPPTHSPATGNNSIPVINRVGLTSFSQFGMGGSWGRGNPLQGPLPVKLASFSSAINGRNVKLNWTTEMEENNSGFEVQKTECRSQESEVWNKIGFVKGNGTKNSTTSYFFEDKNLQSGKYKYRLKQIDYNGNFEYFELAGEVEVGVPAKFDLSQNYPNPFNPVTKINFDLPFDSRVSVRIYDMSGREVQVIVNEQKQAGYYTVQMDAGSLSSGTYFYRIIAEGNGQSYVMTKKAVLIK